MTYQDTLDYLFSQLPMYQRIGAAAYKADLNTTWQLLEALGNPQNNQTKYIHVAGTNGKGSVSHLIASVLQTAGFKTGLFTSPHLKDFRERIKVNGEMVSEEDVVAFVKNNRIVFESIKPSFFEMTAALAFQHFLEQNVDFAILETGMGGRLDSTNVITPEISVITNIGLDHTRFLGTTISAIATEKAGIIKSNRPIISGPMRPEALKTIQQVASEKNAQLIAAPDLPRPYTTDLAGNYQHENLRTAHAALAQLQAHGIRISEENIQTGFNHVCENTGLLGRWQTLSTNPLIICDVGHNADGLRHVVANIERTPHRRLHFLLGMVNDKDIDDALSLLPKNAQYYFCAANIPRALNAHELKNCGAKAKLHGKAYNSVAEAFVAAKAAARSKDLIFIGGSVFVVAEVL